MTLAADLAIPTAGPDSVRRHVLPNGLTLLHRRDVSAPVVAIVTYVKAGYFDETDDVVGIAHVLEHMFFKGTPTRAVGEIARQTKAVGGYLNAHTIYDHTSYYAVVPASGFAAALEIQADAYARSVVDGEELARELEVIIQEAKRKSDNPGAVATETLFEMLHDRHRIRRWRIGREQGLRALTRDHLLHFYRNFYTPANTVLSIVGDVEFGEVAAQVERLYGALPAGTPVRTPGPEEVTTPGFRYRELGGDVAQTQLAIGWRTPASAHPDSVALDLLAVVLGTGRASRLYRAVRERQLASGIDAYNYTPTELGVFVVHAELPPERATDAARATWAEIRRVREEGITEQELERARRIYEARWLRRLEDMEGQANHLAEWEAQGDWTLGNDYLERLLTATREEVEQAARTYLDPAQASVLVYRPESSPVVAADAGAMRALLEAADAEPVAPSGLVATAPVATSGVVARFEREVGGVRVYRTERGLPLLLRHKPGAAIVHLGVYGRGGASLEAPERAGATLLMVRAALKGTTTRSAAVIAEEGELLGGSVSGSAGGDSYGWSISVPARRADAALSLLADVAQNPVFAEDAVETERTVALSGVRALRDDMYRWPMRLLAQAAYEGHPYGTPSSGTEETLATLDAATLREWHRALMQEGELVVGAVGDVEPDVMAAMLAAAFEGTASRPSRALEAPEWPATARERVEQRDKAQTALAIAFPGPGRNDESRFAAELIAGVASGLGGRFFDELRDRQSLCYTVHAFQSERPLAGLFGAYIATSPDKEEVARAGLLAEFEKLRREPVRDEELRRAQTYAIGTHAIRQQSGGAVLGDLIDAWLFGTLEELDEYEGRIRAVTPQAMRALAAGWFDPARLVAGVVRGIGREV